MNALDIPEVQVCIDFPGDPNFTWHQRILLVALGDNGRWVACSPDWENEVVDLNQHRVVPLARGAPLPQRVRGDAFVAAALDQRALDTAKDEARALAHALGAVVPTGGPAASAEWVFSDTGNERFGEVVPGDLVRNPAAMVVRDSMALVEVPEEGWTVAERVLPSDKEEWLNEKRHGPGRDPRVLPSLRDTQKTRYRTVRECLGEMTPLEQPAPLDWPFRGPSAAWELLTSIRAAGEDASAFHEHFLRTTGLAAEHAVAVKHRDLLAVLHHLVCFDQLNAPQLASAECICRYVLQIHQAVRRNPKAPDFRGTGMMVMSRLDSTGGVLTGDFARFVAEEQKSEAFTLKQQRLFAEEEDKRRGKKGGADKP